MRKLGYMLEISCGLRLGYEENLQRLSYNQGPKRQSAGKSGIHWTLMIKTLSTEQLDIIVGLMLGDGSLEFNGYRGTRLQVKQSEEKEEYVFWLYSQLANLVKTPPKQRPDTNQWYFGTRFFENLEDLRKMFYSNRKKVVPANISDLMRSPLTLAVWFMDDGHLDFREKSHYAYHISTDSFSESETQCLQQVLLEKFGIASRVYLSLCRGKYYPKLYIGKEGRDAFTRTIAPYILSCFRYKLPPDNVVYLDPSETTRRAPLILAGDDIVRSS